MNDQKLKPLATAIVETYCMGFDENSENLLNAAKILSESGHVSKAEMDWIAAQLEQAKQDEADGEEGMMRPFNDDSPPTEEEERETIGWIEECANSVVGDGTAALRNALDFLRDYWDL